MNKPIPRIRADRAVGQPAESCPLQYRRNLVVFAALILAS
jgi:hypothetical protein